LLIEINQTQTDVTCFLSYVRSRLRKQKYGRRRGLLRLGRGTMGREGRGEDKEDEYD
jgi:hypothetical protein